MSEYPKPTQEEADELGRLGDAIVEEIAAATTLGRKGLVDLVGPQILSAWRVGFVGIDRHAGGRRPMPQALTEYYAGDKTCGCGSAQIIVKLSNQYGWCPKCGWICDSASQAAKPLRWYKPSSQDEEVGGTG